MATHLVLKEAILQGFVAWVAAGALEEQLVLLAAESDVIKPPSIGLKEKHTAVLQRKTNGQTEEHPGTHGVEVRHGLDLLIVICPSELSKAFWVKLAAVREELGAVLFGQLRAERVDGDDEGSSIGLKLQQKQEVHQGDGPHQGAVHGHGVLV